MEQNMNKTHPAHEILDELNAHYQETKDEMTRRKIVSLVDGELRGEYEFVCQVKRDEARMQKDWFYRVERLMQRVFAGERNNQPDSDPYCLYEQFKEEDGIKNYSSHLAYLQLKFGVESVLKEKDWERVIDSEKAATIAYSELHQSLPFLAEQLRMALLSFKEIIDRKEMIASATGSDQFLYLYGRIANLHRGIVQVVAHAGKDYMHYSNSAVIDKMVGLDFDSKEMKELLQNFRDFSFDRAGEYEELQRGYFEK